MYQDFTPNSFQKGEQFEKYVLSNIFKANEYKLVSRTNNYKENTERFSEDSLRPDFKFRCLKTEREFYVEAKYRSEFSNKKIEGISFQQAQRFRNIQEEEGIPIFIVIGYWRTPDNPYAVSLIPLKEYAFQGLFRSFLQEHDLPIGQSPRRFLNFHKLEKEVTEQATPSMKESLSPKPTASKSKNKIFAVLVIVAVIFIGGMYAFSSTGSSSAPENQLRETITEYYHAMNSNQVERLPEFLSNEVESWYGNTNVNRDVIMKDALNHRGQYPFSKSEIDWNSYKFVQKEDGNYFASFEMIYSAKKKITDEYQVFDLKIISVWDNDLKLKSITEVRN